MKSLYIIGNGFDIAHGLRTDYWEFRMFLESKHLQFLNDFEELYGIQPLDSTEPWYTKEVQKRWDEAVNHDLWSEFEEKMGYPDTSTALHK